MIKLVAPVVKGPDLTTETFRVDRLGSHAPLARAIPGMHGFRIGITGIPVRPEEAAALAAFATSDEAEDMPGTAVILDGASLANG